jgi:hypothetical protein
MKKLFVLFAAVILVAALTAPAMAADWKFYGSARVSGWSIDTDNGAGVSQRTTRFQLQNNSRLGAKVSADKLYGRFEFGINPDIDLQNPTLGNGANAFAGNDAYEAFGTAGRDASDIYTRLLFGVWDFGSGKLLVGQDYTPEYLGISNANQAGGSDSVMLTCGVPYTGRRAQIRLEFGGLQIALVDENGMNNLGALNNAAAAGTVDSMLPKIAAQYSMKLDPVSLTFAGSYLSYDIERTGFQDLTVDAYFLAARGMVDIGPVGLKAVIYYAQNGNELGFTAGGTDGAVITNNAAATGATSGIVDNDTLGFAITASYKLSDMIAFEAGWGKFEAEMDDAAAGNLIGGVVTAGTSGTTTSDERVGYYLQSTITLAKGVYIVPEIGVVDFKDSNIGAAQGDQTYIGAKFQIDF